jgi:hypothetical protein
MDVNWFFESSLVSDSSVNEPNCSICFPFHSRTNNITSLIQKVAKYYDKQWKLIILHYHTIPKWLTDVNELVNIANARRLIGELNRLGIWTYCCNVDGWNRRLAEDDWFSSVPRGKCCDLMLIILWSTSFRHFSFYYTPINVSFNVM